MQPSMQAQPLFRDKKKFVLMADPLLEGNYPMKGLYQALAIAAMCLQEEASVRPLISDVVSALEFLCTGKKDEEDAEDKEASASPSNRNSVEKKDAPDASTLEKD